MKNEKKTHWLRTTILVLVACGIVGLILSAVLFFDNGDVTGSPRELEEMAAFRGFDGMLRYEEAEGAEKPAQPAEPAQPVQPAEPAPPAAEPAKADVPVQPAEAAKTDGGYLKLAAENLEPDGGKATE